MSAPLQVGPSARFAGMRAAVTGAASGVGAAVARSLAAEGARAIALIDQDETGLAAIAADIGRCAVPLACDVADHEQVAGVWRRLAAWDGLDILVTAAAVLGPVTSVVECEPDIWDRVFAVNVKGTYLAVRQAVPMMRQAGAGAIVTISSAGGIVGTPALGPYGGAKAAVIQITRSIAIAHAPDRIRANCVCPGPIDTPMLQERLVDPRDIQRVRERVRLGRFGAPQEVANAVLFFASDAASFITGSALLVDGGELA